MRLRPLPFAVCGPQVHISLSLNQVVKAATPIAVLLISMPLEGKRYALPVMGTSSLIVAGVFMVAWANPGFELIGFCLVFMSLCAASIQLSLAGKVPRMLNKRGSRL